jgi:hypothetical protein
MHVGYLRGCFLVLGSQADYVIDVYVSVQYVIIRQDEGN